jgi:hypothetical protein
MTEYLKIKPAPDLTLSDIGEIRGHIEKLEADLVALRQAHLKAQLAVKALLVTYARDLQGNWYEKTAEDCGLKLNAIGFIKEPALAASPEFNSSCDRIGMPATLVREIYTWMHDGPVDDWDRRCKLHRTLGDMLGEPRVEYRE